MCIISRYSVKNKIPNVILGGHDHMPHGVDSQDDERLAKQCSLDRVRGTPWNDITGLLDQNVSVQ